MIPTWLQEQYQLQRHDDFAREAQRVAETERLLASPTVHAAYATRFSALRAALGAKLVEWGNQLQANTYPIEPIRTTPLRENISPF